MRQDKVSEPSRRVSCREIYWVRPFNATRFRANRFEFPIRQPVHPEVVGNQNLSGKPGVELDARDALDFNSIHRLTRLKAGQDSRTPKRYRAIRKLMARPTRLERRSRTSPTRRVGNTKWFRAGPEVGAPGKRFNELVRHGKGDRLL